ncbi:MAG TPA: four helix bundle protein [Gemmatimonadaceae bacterium]|nr:four helix bundle protein [Gemmatimonadaceae bacterium]
MAGSVRDLKVWQESVALAGDIIRVVRQGARRETTAVGDQLMLTAIGVAEHIADGYSRYTTVEQREWYQAAKRDLLRVETQLAIGRHAELIPAGVYSDLTARIQIVHRLLGGYLVYLDRQLTQELTTPTISAR